LLLVLASVVILRSESLGLMAMFYCLRFEIPNRDGQVTVVISLRKRVAQLYPQTLGSLFVASYDSQCYGGGIRTCESTQYDPLGIKMNLGFYVTRLHCDLYQKRELYK
jgi:hypothetical protein